MKSKDVCKIEQESKMPFIAVIAPEKCFDYLTAGKRYEVVSFISYGVNDSCGALFEIITDKGTIAKCLEKGCSHLYQDNWITVSTDEIKLTPTDQSPK